MTNTVTGKNTSAALRNAANKQAQAHAAAPTGAQLTTATGSNYTKVNNGHTGTYGPSTRGGRMANKNKSNKNKNKNKSNKNKTNKNKTNKNRN